MTGFAGMERWRGKVALVTGASSGIGAACARRLAAEGLRVAACARRRERLDALAGENAAIVPFPVDLRDEAATLAMFAAVRERLGGVDVLVNDAGLGRRAPLAGGEAGTADAAAAWREMLEVNVLALSICTREAVKDMRARGDAGHVIHISSMAAHRVPEGSGLYSASKFAVRSLTEGLRQELRELKSGIRVTAVSPGFVETEFAAVYTGSEDVARKTYARFKCLAPDDVADIVLFALSRPPHVQIHDVLVRPTDQTY